MLTIIPDYIDHALAMDIYLTFYILVKFVGAHMLFFSSCTCSHQAAGLYCAFVHASQSSALLKTQKATFEIVRSFQDTKLSWYLYEKNYTNLANK